MDPTTRWTLRSHIISKVYDDIAILVLVISNHIYNSGLGRFGSRVSGVLFVIYPGMFVLENYGFPNQRGDG